MSPVFQLTAPKAAHRVAVIIVTYHPDLPTLEMSLAALPSETLVVVVDNNSPPDRTRGIEHLLTNRGRARLLRNASNMGLAAAINQGAATVERGQAEFLLLLDQDSVPHERAVEILHHAFLSLEASGEPVGSVGPRLIDSSTGLEHGFHAMKGLRWIRIFPGDSSPVRCANLNGSGTLIRVETFKKFGGLDETLFIDHVDTDWSFRLLAAGLDLFGIPDAVFEHSMGERGIRFWLNGWRVWPVRSPRRHYFLVRNSIKLMRRSYVPLVWKCWAVAKLGATFALHLVFDGRRKAQVAHMLMGLRDGIRSCG